MNRRAPPMERRNQATLKSDGERHDRSMTLHPPRDCRYPHGVDRRHHPSHGRHQRDVPLASGDPTRFHRALAEYNAQRLGIGKPVTHWESDVADECAWRLAEGDFIEAMRSEVSSLLPAEGLDIDSFVEWFQALEAGGPGQGHFLFDWLESEAEPEQMRWFLTQEAAGEAGFEDLVAYAQVKLPAQPKLECARNFWDEMGHGKAMGMHGGLFTRMIEGLDLQPAVDTTVWESLALGNAMVGMATTRRYAYHALGALGAIELTAPGRAKKVTAGMRRIGVEARMCAYFDLHSKLDVAHSRAWIREVVRPLVKLDPDCARFIAEGALIRLACGQKCFERYADEMDVQPRRPVRSRHGRADDISRSISS
jgi:hypothetical protein